jgi:hypothetical protein
LEAFEALQSLVRDPVTEFAVGGVEWNPFGHRNTLMAWKPAGWSFTRVPALEGCLGGNLRRVRPALACRTAPSP